MKLGDLAGILSDAHVDDDLIGVDEDKPDALCVVAGDGSWSVFLCDGDARVEERTFTIENDACVYFLLRAFQLFVRS
jgi:hypothetical protein